MKIIITIPNCTNGINILLINITVRIVIHDNIVMTNISSMG